MPWREQNEHWLCLKANPAPPKAASTASVIPTIAPVVRPLSLLPSSPSLSSSPSAFDDELPEGGKPLSLVVDCVGAGAPSSPELVVEPAIRKEKQESRHDVMLQVHIMRGLQEALNVGNNGLEDTYNGAHDAAYSQTEKRRIDEREREGGRELCT